jgi:hypothetical protein
MLEKSAAYARLRNIDPVFDGLKMVRLAGDNLPIEVLIVGVKTFFAEKTI